MVLVVKESTSEDSEEDKKGLLAAQIATLAKEQEDLDRALAKGKHSASKQKNKPTPPSSQPSTRTHPFCLFHLWMMRLQTKLHSPTREAHQIGHSKMN